MSYSVFVAILWHILNILNKNSQKQIIQKSLRRTKMPPQFCLGLRQYAFQWENTIENNKFVGVGARKVESIVHFLSIFFSHFPNIRVARKRYKIYIESISKYCKNIESMEVTKLERNALPFTGSLQRVLWDIHYVKSVQIRSYFWSAFFCTRTRNNFRIWTLFTQC